MTKPDNIEEMATNYLELKHSFTNIEDARWTAFVAGAKQIQRDLDIAIEALNKIGMAQMGSLDYTQDFFELTKNIVRDTLERLK